MKKGSNLCSENAQKKNCGISSIIYQPYHSSSCFQSPWFQCIIIESDIFTWWVSRGGGGEGGGLHGSMFLKKWGGIKKGGWKKKGGLIHLSTLCLFFMAFGKFWVMFLALVTQLSSGSDASNACLNRKNSLLNHFLQVMIFSTLIAHSSKIIGDWKIPQ